MKDREQIGHNHSIRPSKLNEQKVQPRKIVFYALKVEKRKMAKKTILNNHLPPDKGSYRHNERKTNQYFLHEPSFLGLKANPSLFWIFHPKIPRYPQIL